MDNENETIEDPEEIRMSIGEAVVVYTVLGWLGVASAYTSYKLSYAVASKIANWRLNRRFDQALATLNTTEDTTEKE